MEAGLSAWLWLRLWLLVVWVTHGIHGYGLGPHRFSSGQGNLPERISIGEGESVLLFWRPSHQPLTECNVTTPTGRNLNLMSSKPHPGLSLSSNHKFRDGYCCLIIEKTSSESNGLWYMWSSNKKEYYNTKTNLTVIRGLVPVNQSLTVVEGTTKSFTCGSSNALYCHLTDPKGNRMTYAGPCFYTMYSVSAFQVEGTWSCDFSVQDFTTVFSASVEVTVVEESDKKELEVLEYQDEIVIFCKMPRDVMYSKFCKVTTPYGLELYLTPGTKYKRYTYFGSKASHCGVTIPKPLDPSDEGPWKCQLVYSLTGTTPEIYGGYVTIGQETKLRGIETKSDKLFWTPQNDDHAIVCHVPYVIEYCWFKSPNGTIYNINKESFSLEQGSNKVKNEGFKFGDCALNFDNFPKNQLPNMTGNWTCNIGLATNSITEMSKDIMLIYSDVPVISAEKEVSGKLGSQIAMKCITGEGVGIKYCRLVRPDGKGITLDPLKNNSDYSYYGRGLIYGECGVTIHYVKNHDIGSWTCTVKTIELISQEYSSHITVKEEKANLVALYVVIGIIGLVSLLGASFFVMKKYNLQIRPRRSNDTVSLLRNEGTDENSSLCTERDSASIGFVRRRSPLPSRQESHISHI